MTNLRLTLCALIFIFFFSGLLIHYGLLPEQVNFLPELLILGMSATALQIRKRVGMPLKIVGLPFALGLVVFSVISTVGNDRSWIECILFLRILLRFYLMFLALINIGMSEKHMRWFIVVLAVCLFIQVPVAAIRLLFEGQGERAIGTYAYRGGVYSVVLPMMMTGFLLSYYIAFRRSKWFLIGMLLFVAFGIIGGKRATFVMVPIAGLFAVVLGSRFDVTGKRFSPKLLAISAITFVLVFYLSVRMLPTLNPENQFWGSFDMDHILDFTQSYDTKVTESGYTTGRSSTNLRAIEITASDTYIALMGKGAGSLIKSRIEGAGREKTGTGLHSWGGAIEGVGILYGMTGFSFLLLQLGYPGMIVWLSFYVYLVFKLRRMALYETTLFWRAYTLGCASYCCSALLLSVTYTSSIIQGDLDEFLFFLFLAFAFIRQKQAKSLIRLRAGRPNFPLNLPAHK